MFVIPAPILPRDFDWKAGLTASRLCGIAVGHSNFFASVSLSGFVSRLSSLHFSANYIFAKPEDRVRDKANNHVVSKRVRSGKLRILRHR